MRGVGKGTRPILKGVFGLAHFRRRTRAIYHPRYIIYYRENFCFFFSRKKQSSESSKRAVFLVGVCKKYMKNKSQVCVTG